ncbi:MAG: hypothetical protein JO065_17310 [Acidobacteria bacterium]|nr:hypothetical protein [Acidobacteriota bacterium]
MRLPRHRVHLLLCCTLALVACNDPARPGSRRGKPISTTLLCDCKPTHITKDDWRIEYKNGPLPPGPAQEITVSGILAWPQGAEPGPRTPRSGRELQLFRIGKAYMQTAFIRVSDCDLHVEISEQADKNSPRMIIETPGRPEYCESRSKLFAELQRRGITLTDLNQELQPPIPVQVTGTAFRDQAHPIWFARGSDKVATLWELHPVEVAILP